MTPNIGSSAPFFMSVLDERPRPTVRARLHNACCGSLDIVMIV
jgi:hypothetical protein